MADKDLDIFRLVAETGSNSEAARILGISESSVSRTITKLEEEFNTKLINRGSFPLTVTPNGVVLINLIDDGMSIRQRFRRYIEQQSLKHLSIGFSFPVSCSLFSSELSRFKQNEPSITIQTFSGDCTLIRNMLAERKLDLAFTSDRISFGGYKMSKMKDDFEWGLAAMDGVPLTDNHYVRCEDLNNHPLLVPVDISSHAVIGKWIGEQERILISDTYNSIDTLTEMLNKGYGVGFVPRTYLPHLIRYDISFYLLSPKIFTPIYIYNSVSEERFTILSSLLELLKDKII